jgi:hypothetical protein
MAGGTIVSFELGAPKLSRDVFGRVWSKQSKHISQSICETLPGTLFFPVEQLSQKTLQPGTLVFPVGQLSQKTLVFPVGQLSQKTLQQVLGVPVEAPPVVPPPCQCGFLKGVRILKEGIA